ncbi:MAG: IS200/IS605 family element transposase accessory protein TnpB [Okeania sp. SIO2C9]|uniref:RNA-guided endonuclease InsQ/TnpB family protein n=1 Tax=Okeania sp. SIO2C9 TaxID=2607791 RepID=UPI0013BF44FE|nr:transposase [Okeania sp. SIO2C9]NEQ72258.1 IS200/IS605 family element transposase accessory protein TnpB [Okeania sp. SIO2C9]
MLVSHCYKIKPSQEQITKIDNWLELLRRHYNYGLAQRLDWLNRTRCQIDRCSLISCPIGEIPGQPNYHYQSAELKQTKKLFPEYKEIYFEVQQNNLRRLDKSWQRWLIPDKTGKRFGRPRFKKSGKLRSLSFSRVNHPKAAIKFDGKHIIISRFGSIPVIVHRPIPDGFTIKTATITKKADGYYVSFSLEDKSVPSLIPTDSIKTAVGVDVGLKEFLTTNTGETVSVPNFYRKAQSNLVRKQRKVSRKQIGSNNWKKAQNRIARLHQHIARQREEFHYKTAHKLVKKYDLIAVENLNIRGLARNTKLSKSIYDVAWGEFIIKLNAVAIKRGVHVVKVNPHNTSQNCSNCAQKVPKTLSVRTHSCPKCGTVLDRDENAAINILNKALNEVGLILSACGGLDFSQPVKQETSEAWVQLSLF